MRAASARLLASVEAILAGALTLKDASLVVFRRGVLIEFKTALLSSGLAATKERRYRGWQVGPIDGHHCHLDLASIASVWFDAEPVSCQGGRLTYTICFVIDGDCGNPYRPGGLFSITLNAPYAKNGATRTKLVEAVYALHDRHREAPFVFASEAFVAARPTS
jgi:hypothetical protein